MAMRALLLALAALLGALPAPAQPAPRLRLTLASPTPRVDGSFGSVVLQASDYDGDGFPDYLVSAIEEGDGRVHALSGRDGHPLYLAEGARGCEFTCAFGFALARLPDVTGDGVDDLAVGAPGEPGPGGDTPGGAYVLSGADGAIRWRVASPTPDDFGGFGRAVGALGDVNGDGWADVFVSELSGAGLGLHLYSGRTGARLSSLPHVPLSLAPLADRTGDGVPDLVGGHGRVYVYDGATAVPFDTLSNPVDDLYSLFGWSVAEVGDLDGDGVAEIVVGAALEGGPPEDPAAAGAGRAYVFSGATGAVRDTLSSPTPELSFGGRFGWAVAGGTDVSGDGVPDVAVGAPYEDAIGGNSQGNVHVYSGADGALLYTLTSPVPQNNAHFGWSVAFVTTPEGAPGLAVGVPQVGELLGSPPAAGRVYVYSFGDSTVASAPSPEAGGLSVAVSPNPSAGAAWATLTVASVSSVRVVVVDAVGRVVAVLHDGPVSAGSVRLSLPSGLAAGVYAVVAEGAGAAVARARWVVAR